MTDAIVVYVTAANEEEAVVMAKALVNERLAACINIVRGIRSIYTWQGKIEDDAEVLMIIKTKAEVFDALQERIKGLHSYTVPEIIALPIVRGSQSYMQWLDESVGD